MANLWQKKRVMSAYKLGPEAFQRWCREQEEAIKNFSFGGFSGEDIELTEEDILRCMEAIGSRQLPRSEEYSSGRTKAGREKDFRIMEECLDAVRQGKEVVYTAWW